jgi:hypothetical protein
MLNNLWVVIKTVKSPGKSKAGNIGKSHQWQYIPKIIEDLNVKWTPMDGAVLKLDLSDGQWYYATDSALTCVDVQDCIEAFTNLDLSTVVVTLGEINGDIVFTAGTTIDRTNTTNTGIQYFDNNYIANYDGSTINNTDSIINNEWTTINNYPWLNLIQCDNIVVWITPNPTTFAVPVGTDMIKVTLTDVTVYWPDDQTNPWCLPPYELWHTTVNYTPYNLTIWGSVSCTQTFVTWCGYSWTNPVWVVSILWDAITNEIIVLWQLIDWATQLPMYSVDVCFYQFTSDVTITNNIDSTTNYLGDNVINLEDGASITNNLDGTVNNNYGDTYEENNDYENGSIFNYTGDVENNYDNYNEENNYTDSEVTNNGWTFNYNDVNVNYDEDSEVTYEWDVTFEWDMYLWGNIINTFNESNNATTAVEVWPGVSWTDINNALTCDGSDTVATPIDPTTLDSVSLVIADTIVGDTKSNAITSGSPAVYGWASDLRWNTLTPAEVNASDFGAVFKFGDSAWIKVTGFNFAIPVTDTILWVKVNVIFTSTVDTVNVDCITMTVYHTDNSEFTSWVMVQQAGVDVAQATTLNFQSWATVTDMWGGVVNVDVMWGGGWTGLVNIGSANDSLVYASAPTWVLTGDLPISADLIHLTTDSWTNLILWVDYSVDILTGTITWILAPTVGETVYARWVTGNRQPGTVPGGLAYYEEFIATPAQTTFILNDTPAGANWIRVSTESSLYGKRTLIASRDRHYDIGTNSIVFEYPLAENDVVSVQYIGFVVAPVNQVSDETYWPTWDEVTDIAPSKNAVFDKIESMSSWLVTWSTTIDAVTWLTIGTNDTATKQILTSWFLYWTAKWPNSGSVDYYAKIEFSPDNSTRSTMCEYQANATNGWFEWDWVCIYVPAWMYVRITTNGYSTFTIDKFISL